MFKETIDLKLLPVCKMMFAKCTGAYTEETKAKLDGAKTKESWKER